MVALKLNIIDYSGKERYVINIRNDKAESFVDNEVLLDGYHRGGIACHAYNRYGCALDTLFVYGKVGDMLNFAAIARTVGQRREIARRIVIDMVLKKQIDIELVL